MTSSSRNSNPRSRPGAVTAVIRPAWVWVLLAAVTLAAFWPAVQCDFVNFDDPDYFSSNTHVLAGLTPDSIGWAFRTTHTQNWYPLTWLSFMLDVDLFGKGPAGPHFTNLLLHATNAMLLFLLLQRLTGLPWCSAFVTALFAWHPLRVESVVWITERKDVLSTFFGLLTLLMYERYARERGGLQHSTHARSSSLRRNHEWCYYGAALGCYALALMSKSMLTTFPFVLLLLDYWPMRRTAIPGAKAAGSPMSKLQFRASLRLLGEKAPFFALSTISCVITFLTHKASGALVAMHGLSLTARIENAFVSYARYLGKSFWPVDLALPYPHPGLWSLNRAAPAFVLVILLCIVAFRLGGRRPYVFVGWFWFFGTLIPVIGLIQWGSQAMADRFTYVPHIGLFLLAAWGASEAFTGGRVPKSMIGVAAGLVLAACVLRTRNQINYWQNSECLFRHAIAVTQNNRVACENLAAHLITQGRIGEATDWYREAIAIEPGRAKTHSDLGAALALNGKLEAAIEQYGEALRLGPDSAATYNNLGYALAAKGRLDEASGCYRKAIQLDSNFASPWYNLGLALAGQGALDEAAGCYRNALRTNPDHASAHRNLGNLLMTQGRFETAARHYRHSLKINRNQPGVCFDLGRALAALGRTNEAVAQFTEVLRLRPDDAAAKEQLRVLGGAVAGPKP